MQLYHQIFGQGQPLIIAHGLFGTFENWGNQIKRLAEHYQVIAVDLRNHGRSPHSDKMTYADMAADIIELMDSLSIENAFMLGHSMGGKAMMELALNYPTRVQKLIVVDIAPVQYPHHHQDVFSGLMSLELATIKSRSDADQQLSAHVKDTGVRAFLLKNLYRDEQKNFCWRMNLAVLHNKYQDISLAPKGTAFAGATLFIKGANSNYLLPEYKQQVLALFPNANYKIIQNAGHWPHAEQADAFSKSIEPFLNS